ncbi:uncharacterized protein N7484_003138 [Penicillium longicatenatum]|uniref:uncharacterized protein n=1 Tax=Penicillium longicatenatum TaxID=1561947 RepID=UPI0025492DC9|nr:uncharacterized protein N7484_003138 [Penicillium longicatenatum]KAJ5649415.1 hypothetical protein N7484_003138 [Penicillium longicatenatum]
MTSLKSTNTVTVFRGQTEPGCYVWSPFVTKLEARLRFGKIAYRTEAGSVPNAPKGKVPYISIEDDDGTTLLSDSGLITKEFIKSGKLEDLNRNLSSTQKLHDIALQALLEDKLYFYGTHEKWCQNYYAMRDKVLGTLPWPVRVIVGNMVYNKNVRNMMGQGTGKFSEQEIAAFRIEIWDMLNATISESHAQHRGKEGPFWVWGGDAPTEADAVVYGFVVSGLTCGPAAPITKGIIKGHPALVEYARRIHDTFFPDYELQE